MSLRSHTKSIGIPAEGTHPGGDTPASLVDRDGKSADDTNDDTNDDTTGHTADRTEIVWSFDQPLRGDTIDEQEQELIDTDVAETKGATVNGITQSMTPQRDRLTGSTSLKAIVRPGARKIAQRPKTPARLGIRTSAMDVTDEDGTDLSSPIRAQGAWFAAAANETTLDCGREGGSSIAMNRRRPLLRQTLSELLRSDDGSTLTETSIPSFPQPTSSASQGLLARTRNGGRLPANDNIDGHGEKCDEREGRSWFVDMTLSQLMRTSSETGQDVLPFSKDPVPPAKRSSVSDDPVSLRQFAKRTGVKAKPTAMTPSTHHVTIQSPYTPESPGRPHRKPNQTPIPKRKTDLTRAARLERSPSTQLIPASGRAGPQVDEGDVDEDANIRIGILGEDDDDEYEPLPDIPDAPGDSHDEAKYGEIALVERTRLPVKPAYYPPAPWTPSSHRPSPEPVLESPHTWERKGWYRNRSSSPLTFSRSVSPLERLVTPPFEPDTTLLDPTIGRGNRNQAEKHGRKNGKRCKGAWKGEAVLRRMEEGDRAEAEFWLWIGGQEGIDGSKRNRAKKRGAEDDDATDMESDGGLHDTDGAELVGADGGEKTARQPRRKTKRAQLLDVLYDTEAMDRRIRHYEALADEYELRFETVW